MEENEILGFDPTTVFDSGDSSNNSSSNIYKTKPADSKSKDGVYRSTIKVIFNPYDFRRSFLEQTSYGLTDKDGWFSVVSSLTNEDKSCPIFTAWKKCRYAPKDSILYKQFETEGLFDKRFARYCLIQVMEDENQPDLQGRYMLWKLPKSILDLIQSKQNPAVESKKAPIPVMDYLVGYSIDLEVRPGPDDPAHPERKQRETKYYGEFSNNIVPCTNPDGSPILNDEERAVIEEYVTAMQEVWESKDREFRDAKKVEITHQPFFPKVSEIYRRVTEDIKSWSPNLKEELGYKPWTPEETERVNNWIKLVLEGKNPAHYVEVEGITTSTAAAAPAAAAPTPATPPTKADEVVGNVPSFGGDDLPF